MTTKAAAGPGEGSPDGDAASQGHSDWLERKIEAIDDATASPDALERRVDEGDRIAVVEALLEHLLARTVPPPLWLVDELTGSLAAYLVHHGNPTYLDRLPASAQQALDRLHAGDQTRKNRLAVRPGVLTLDHFLGLRQFRAGRGESAFLPLFAEAYRLLPEAETPHQALEEALKLPPFAGWARNGNSVIVPASKVGGKPTSATFASIKRKFLQWRKERETADALAQLIVAGVEPGSD